MQKTIAWNLWNRIPIFYDPQMIIKNKQNKHSGLLP